MSDCGCTTGKSCEYHAHLFPPINDSTAAPAPAENGPRRFRKKPVVIEAMRWTGDNADEVREFTRGAADYNHRTTGGICIKTLNGPVWAHVGEWVVRGVEGEFYPCAADIFKATYDPEEESRKL